MSIKFVVASYEKDSYDDFLGPCIENIYPVKRVFNEDANGICEKYNLGIQHFVKEGLLDTDVIAFCHGDVKILDSAFKEKVEYIFSNIPNLGVAGVIGTTELHDTCGWWLSEQRLHRGHLMQWVDSNPNNKYHMTRTIGNYTNMVTIDGLCMLVKGELAKKLPFDSETFPNTYNFYDADYSLMAREAGYKVGVFDILLEHKSAGTGIFEDDWAKNKVKFLTKWVNKGQTFPIK